MGVIINFPRASGSNEPVEPDDEIIKTLEDLLERAIAGELRSLMTISAGADGHPECSMTLDRCHCIGIIGTVEVAKARIVNALEVTEGSVGDC